MASKAAARKRSPVPHAGGGVHPHAFDIWPARVAVAVIAALQLLLINDFAIGPRWLAPVLELALLLPLSVATAWHQGRVRRASTDAHWAAVERHGLALRRAAMALTAVVSCMNFG